MLSSTVDRGVKQEHGKADSRAFSSVTTNSIYAQDSTSASSQLLGTEQETHGKNKPAFAQLIGWKTGKQGRIGRED